MNWIDVKIMNLKNIHERQNALRQFRVDLMIGIITGDNILIAHIEILFPIFLTIINFEMYAFTRQQCIVWYDVTMSKVASSTVLKALFNNFSL